MTTKRCNHAHDLVCSESDFSSRWSCVVVVSGDGLLFEVLQGVFRREDWREARKVPLAILAGGSGNGLARSLAFEVRDRAAFFTIILKFYSRKFNRRCRTINLFLLYKISLYFL